MADHAIIAFNNATGSMVLCGADDPLPVTLNAGQGTGYETVAAGQTDQVLGASGAAGDILCGLVIIPGTLSPGGVSIKDGSGSAISLFAGGISSLVALAPLYVPLNVRSTSGAWKVTTGANVTALAIGSFT